MRWYYPAHILRTTYLRAYALGRGAMAGQPGSKNAMSAPPSPQSFKGWLPVRCTQDHADTVQCRAVNHVRLNYKRSSGQFDLAVVAG